MAIAGMTRWGLSRAMTAGRLANHAKAPKAAHFGNGGGKLGPRNATHPRLKHGVPAA